MHRAALSRWDHPGRVSLQHAGVCRSSAHAHPQASRHYAFELISLVLIPGRWTNVAVWRVVPPRSCQSSTCGWRSLVAESPTRHGLAEEASDDESASIRLLLAGAAVPPMSEPAWQDQFDDIVDHLDQAELDETEQVALLDSATPCPRTYTDRGPAGSLFAELEELRARLNSRRARGQRQLTIAASALIAAVVIVLALVEAMPWWTSVAVVACAVTAAATAHHLLTPRAERELQARGRMERRVASTLRAGLGPAWIVFADRLAPDTNHRLPILLVGPPGLVILDVVMAGRLRKASKGPQLLTRNGTDIGHRIALTSAASAKTLAAVATESFSSDLAYTVASYPTTVLARRHPLSRRSRLDGAVGDVTLRDERDLIGWLTGLTSVLARAQSDDLAHRVEARALPAPE